MAGFLGFGSYTPPQSTIDPNFANLVSQQQAQAGAYQANAGNLAAQQGTQASENARQSLASKMASNKSNANRRGLLYSGTKQAADAGAQQQAGSQLAQQQTAINDKIQDQSQNLQNQAIQSGIALQQAQQQAAGQNYENDMSQKQAKSKAISGLLGTIGSVTGGGAGSR